MIFVAIGFQHSVANCFVIPAAIFEGQATWLEFLSNFIPVYIGNIIGGAIFVSGFITLVINIIERAWDKSKRTLLFHALNTYKRRKQKQILRK